MDGGDRDRGRGRCSSPFKHPIPPNSPAAVHTYIHTYISCLFMVMSFWYGFHSNSLCVGWWWWR